MISLNFNRIILIRKLILIIESYTSGILNSEFDIGIIRIDKSFEVRISVVRWFRRREVRAKRMNERVKF